MRDDRQTARKETLRRKFERSMKTLETTFREVLPRDFA